MWTDCPQVLDQPIEVLGLELEDLALATALPVLASLYLDTLPCFGLGLALGMALHYGKRGRPAGTLLHVLHDLQICRLPGFLSPHPRTYSPW